MATIPVYCKCGNLLTGGSSSKTGGGSKTCSACKRKVRWIIRNGVVSVYYV